MATDEIGMLSGILAQTLANAQLLAQSVSTTVNKTTTPLVLLQSMQIMASNPERKGFILFNNSANSLYVTYGPVCISATCSIIIPTYAQYVHIVPCIYTGPVSAIRNAGTGTVTITEFV